MKVHVDKMAVIDQLLSNDNLTVHVLNSLGSDFRDIAGLICARKTLLTFERFYNLLVSYEGYLKSVASTTKSNVRQISKSNNDSNSQIHIISHIRQTLSKPTRRSPYL